MKIEHHTESFWISENTSQDIETGLECPECGSELFINQNTDRLYAIYHEVICSNDECTYVDRIQTESF